MMKRKKNKTKYRIRRIVNFNVVECYLQFQDSQGEWRYVPKTFIMMDKPMGEHDCIRDWGDIVRQDEEDSALMMNEYMHAEGKLVKFARENPDINKWLEELEKNRKNMIKRMAENQEKDAKRKISEREFAEKEPIVELDPDDYVEVRPFRLPL